MLRHLYFYGMAVLCSFVCVSCLLEQPTSPANQDNQPLIFSIVNLDSAISALAGELHPAAFDVVVMYESDQSVKDIEVTFSVISGPGSIATENSVTDSTGTIHALFYLNIPNHDTLSVIRVFAAYDSTEFTIDIHSKPNPDINQEQEPTDAFEKLKRTWFKKSEKVR
ncbi:MAG: hypothetical protein HQ568_05330, partial [Calditrichaeota bacterium]|nr:hypothetical protein [Calditrichota bacterium]